MSNQLIEDQDKIDEYLRIIQERILLPINRFEIQSSCTANLLLLFAAIDGLGKLLHPNDNAKVTSRIKSFFDFMGGDYAVRKKELVNLRHSLVHNAINVESYLSQTETGRESHLRKIGAAGFIYVNTMVMSKDFNIAFERFKVELQNDSELMKRAARRLEWIDDDAWDNLDVPGVATPTPPPSVQFIYSKGD